MQLIGIAAIAELRVVHKGSDRPVSKEIIEAADIRAAGGGEFNERAQIAAGVLLDECFETQQPNWIGLNIFDTSRRNLRCVFD